MAALNRFSAVTFAAWPRGHDPKFDPSLHKLERIAMKIVIKDYSHIVFFYRYLLSMCISWFEIQLLINVQYERGLCLIKIKSVTENWSILNSVLSEFTYTTEL